MTRVWCCYEFAWWLKHKGEGSIAFVPLQMYSTILRLTLKGVPLTAAVLNALLGLQFVWWVVFGRYVLATWIEPTTMSAQEREEMNASARNATNSSALLAAGFCFLIFVICAALILVPARRERREVAL